MASLTFQHGVYPLLPLNLLHIAYIPVYAEHGSDLSIHPSPLLTQPEKNSSHYASVIDVPLSEQSLSLQLDTISEFDQHGIPFPVNI